MAHNRAMDDRQIRWEIVYERRALVALGLPISEATTLADAQAVYERLVSGDAANAMSGGVPSGVPVADEWHRAVKSRLADWAELERDLLESPNARPAVAAGRGQCGANTTEWDGSATHCMLEEGHAGKHFDGCVTWVDRKVVRHRLRIEWRRRSGVLVENPDAQWFKSVQLVDDGGAFKNRVVRMALLDDGRLLFADGYYVVHNDMKACALHGASPLFVTVFVHNGDTWKHGLVEQWCGSGDKSTVKERFHALCLRHIEWQGICRAMGNDPLDASGENG